MLINIYSIYKYNEQKKGGKINIKPTLFPFNYIGIEPIYRAYETPSHPVIKCKMVK